MEVDIPTARSRILSLPDFVENTRIANGNLKLSDLVSANDLLSQMETVLRDKTSILGRREFNEFPI